jgi:MFS family permease
MADAPRRFRGATLLAFAALDAAGYGVIAPVLPAVARTTGAGPAVIGALAATFSAAMVIGFSLSGRRLARGRSRGVLGSGLVLVAAGSVLFAVGRTLPVFFAARVLMGAGSGDLWMGITFQTFERWPGAEYRAMSRVYAAYSFGGLVGPLIGAAGGITAPFLIYAGLCAAGLAILPLLAPPSVRRTFRSDRSVLRRFGFWHSAAAVMFALLALGVTDGVLPLHLASGLTQGEIGLLFAASAVVVAVASAGAARLRPRPAVNLSLVLVTAGIGAVGLSASVPVWIAGLFVSAVGIGFANTGSTGLLLDAVDPERIVTAVVVWSQVAMLGYLAGPLAGGAAVQAGGFGTIGLVVLGSALLVVALSGRRRAAPVTTGGA